MCSRFVSLSLSSPIDVRLSPAFVPPCTGFNPVQSMSSTAMWVMLNYAANTATPEMHEAGTVPLPTRMLRNEATLPLMCASGRE